VVAERALDFLRIDALAAVEAADERGDDLLGFILAEILDESVEKCSPARA